MWPNTTHRAGAGPPPPTGASPYPARPRTRRNNPTAPRSRPAAPLPPPTLRAGAAPVPRTGVAGAVGDAGGGGVVRRPARGRGRRGEGPAAQEGDERPGTEVGTGCTHWVTADRGVERSAGSATAGPG